MNASSGSSGSTEDAATTSMSSRPASTSVDHVDGFPPVGRAGHVRRSRRRAPSRPVRRTADRTWSGCSCSTSAAVRRQRDSDRRRSAPSPVHGTSASTRSKTPPRQAGRVPSATTTVGGVGIGAQSLGHQPGPVRGQLGGQQVGSVMLGQPGQQGGLASRSGAQVQPPVGPGPRLRGAAGRLGGDPRQPPGSQLGSLVLHTGKAVADRRQLGRVARPARRVRAPATGLGAGVQQVVHLGQTGSHDQADRSGVVVGVQCALDLAGGQQIGVRVDDPAAGGPCAGPARRRDAARRPARRSTPRTTGPRPCGAPR